MPPREFVSWLAVPVQTSKGAGAPKLTDKCALRVESEALGCSAHLACGTEESTVFRQTFEGSALDKSEGCQIEQVADVLPNHFRYQVRAFTSNGNTIYIDTREGVVRYESGDAHLRFKLIDAGPTSTVRVPANLLSTPSALREPLRLQGRVASVTGVAPVPHGASCTAKIDPDHTTSNNCQIEVSCGGKVLYRNASASCALSDNGAVSFRDAAPTLLDGTPTLSVTEGGSFGIGDESSTGGWSVGVEPLRD